MTYKFKGDFLVSQNDVIRFSELIGDDNPIHLNLNDANKAGFEKQVVHGVLLAGVFSKHFGTIYPGNGAIYLGQSLNFRKPVYSDGLYYYEIELVQFDLHKKIGIFDTKIFTKNNQLCLEGEAKLKWAV
jgi:acyl dehydratase